MNNVHFAIPEIYGETLSYYELLRKIVTKMNELIDNYNTVPDQIDEAVKNLDASQLFSTVLSQLIHSIATDNTKSAYAVKMYKKHDLLYATFNETVKLYESLIDFSTGTETELIVGSNIREVNISELLIELRKLIDNEAQARTQADQALQTNIDNEAQTRTHGDQALQTNIDNEAQARTQADQALQTNIDNEAQARTQADQVLQTNIDNDINTLRTMLSSPYNFKGEVASISALPETGNVNDTYYVQDVKYKVTWTGSAWVQSSLSEADYQTELSETKSDLHNNRQYELVNGIYTVTQASLVNGDYGVGGVIHSDSRYLRVPNFVNVPKGSYIGFIGGTNINVLVIGIYNINGIFIEERIIESNKGYVFTDDCKAVICFRNNTMSNVTPSEYDATTIIVNSALYQFDVSGRNKYIVPKSEITQNMLDYDGKIYTYETKSNRLYNQHFLKVKKGDCVMLNNADSKIYKYAVMLLFDIETINRANISWLWYNESEVIKMPQDGYLYLTIAPQSDSTKISQTDYNDNIVIYPGEYGFNFTIDLEAGGYVDNEYGEYSAERINFNNHRRNKYPTKTNGAEFVIVPSAMNSITSLSVIEYDENRTKIRSTQLTSTPNLLSNGQIKLSNSCEYIEVELYGNTEKLPNSIDLVFYGGEKDPEATKRIARMNFPTTSSDQLLYSVEDDVYSSLRLILPSNYSTEGDKVPLIVWMRGSSSSSSWTDDFNSADYYPTKYFEYLRDEGFAVCAILNWGSYYIDKYGINVENASPYPTPTCRKVFVDGIKYVCDRYNVDIDNVHLLGHSQGGQLETFYVTNPDLPFKSICMFSPVNDYLSMPGDRFYVKTRQAIAEDLGLEGDVVYFVSDEYRTYTDEGIAFLQSNIDKINQLNEAWNSMVGGTLQSRFDDAINDCHKFWENGTANPSRTDIYVHTDYAKIGRVPTKVWGAPDDDQTPYRKMTEIVSQIKNGGGYAEMRTFESGGHFAPVSSYPINSVTTKLGTVYTDLPSGWKEAVDFMRVCMTKH